MNINQFCKTLKDLSIFQRFSIFNFDW